MADTPVDLAQKLSMFTNDWSPKVVARVNDYEVKVVKLKGEGYGIPMTPPTNCFSSSKGS